MGLASELGMSEQDVQDAMNLEKLYTLIKSNNITCQKCLRSPTYADLPNQSFLCNVHVAGRAALCKQIGVDRFTSHELQRLQKKYGTPTSNVSGGRRSKSSHGKSSHHRRSSKSPRRKRSFSACSNDSFASSNDSGGEFIRSNQNPTRSSSRSNQRSQTMAQPIMDSQIDQFGPQDAFISRQHVSPTFPLNAASTQYPLGMAGILMQKQSHMMNNQSLFPSDFASSGYPRPRASQYESSFRDSGGHGTRAPPYHDFNAGRIIDDLFESNAQNEFNRRCASGGGDQSASMTANNSMAGPNYGYNDPKNFYSHPGVRPQTPYAPSMPAYQPNYGPSFPPHQAEYSSNQFAPHLQSTPGYNPRMSFPQPPSFPKPYKKTNPFDPTPSSPSFPQNPAHMSYQAQPSQYYQQGGFSSNIPQASFQDPNTLNDPFLQSMRRSHSVTHTPPPAFQETFQPFDSSYSLKQPTLSYQGGPSPYFDMNRQNFRPQTIPASHMFASAPSSTSPRIPNVAASEVKLPMSYIHRFVTTERLVGLTLIRAFYSHERRSPTREEHPSEILKAFSADRVFLICGWLGDALRRGLSYQMVSGCLQSAEPTSSQLHGDQPVLSTD